MSETRTTAVAVTSDSPKAAALAQSASFALARAGSWATDTALEFGEALSALMGPAVFVGYPMAAWSLASNLNWTDTFLFTAGPLSNWLVWMGLAVSVNLAAGILRRHARRHA